MSERITVRTARSRRRGVLPALVLTVCLAAAVHAENAPVTPPWKAYLQTFRRHLELAEQDLPHIAAVADGLADGFVEHQAIWLCPTQESLLGELLGRASGMTAAKAWRWPWQRIENGIVLVGVPPVAERPKDRSDWINNALARSGTKVLAFSNARDLAARPNRAKGRPLEPGDFHAFFDNHVPAGQFTFEVPAPEGTETRHVGLSQLVNVLNGMLFTGEITSACTRRGKMPNYWLSFAIDEPRGYWRARKYSEGTDYHQQPSFHTHFCVPPVEPEVIGRTYISRLRSYLDRLENWPDLGEISDRIAARIRAGKTVHFFFIGHIFPRIVPEDQRDYLLKLLSSRFSDRVRALEEKGHEGDMLFLLCMPTYDDRLVGMALNKGMDVIVASTAPPIRAHQGKDEVRWLAAPWPIEDGCVEIPGYDMPILPATGIMNSVIYYAVLAQVQHNLAEAEKDATAEAPAVE